MWYSENCFEARSAHQLPQTGHDPGIKFAMTGMRALVRALSGHALVPGVSGSGVEHQLRLV